MQIFGTNFTLSLGAWRLRFLLALEDMDDETPVRATRVPHRLRVHEDELVR